MHDSLSSQPYKDIAVSVIIATKNSPREIQRTLRALLNGSRCPNEIIVLDQSEDDLTRNEVECVLDHPLYNCVRYVHSIRTGLSANRNDALREATGEFIASVDDDVIVDEKWLELMLREWVETWNKNPVLITGRILPAPEFEEGALVTALRESNERRVFDNSPQFSDVLTGAQFGASRELFDSLGSSPFDENLGLGARFPAAEDDEFAYRVQKQGMPVVYEPSIFTLHYTQRIDGWRKMRFGRGIGNGAAMTKHFMAGDISMFFAFLKSFVIQIAKGLRFVIKFDEPEGTARLIMAIGLIYGMIGWTFARITSQLVERNSK